MKIVISGDSVTFGQGCADKITVYDEKLKFWKPRHDNETTSVHCWASLLNKYYNQHQVYNYAMPGSDNIFISTSIIDNIDGADLVIFPATGFNRMQIYNPYNGKKDSWVIGTPATDYSPEYKRATEEYVKYIYSEDYMVEVSTMAILGVAAQCYNRKIPFLWSAPMYGTERIDDHKGIYKDFNRRMAVIENFRIPSLFDYWQSVYYGYQNVPKLEDNPFMHNDGHSNEIGHKYYFEHEILPRLKPYLG